MQLNLARSAQSSKREYKTVSVIIIIHSMRTSILFQVLHFFRLFEQTFEKQSWLH